MGTNFLGKNLFANQGIKDRMATKGVNGDDLLYAKYNAGDAMRSKSFSEGLHPDMTSKNDRYAVEFVGWDKAQDLRKKAEAADVGAVPPPGGRYERRYNYVTNEMEWLKKESSNFWKANKDELIQMGGFLAGGLIGAPMLGYSLAKTARDVYKMRDARRDFKDQKRDWEYQQALAAQEEAKYGPKGGNLFKNIGEGTVEWATKDVERNKRKGTYERGAV